MKRIMAEFVPQAWIRNYAVDVDPEGPTQWDVTEYIQAMGWRAALLLRDNRHETDDLRTLDHAPEWVREWSGPFYVRVQEAIADYFDDERRLT